MSICLRRRDFITALGGAAAWPLAARAQQGNRIRRIGVLWPGDENDPFWETEVSAFTQALAGLGWTDGRNVRMDVRWGGDEFSSCNGGGHLPAPVLKPKANDTMIGMVVSSGSHNSIHGLMSARGHKPA